MNDIPMIAFDANVRLGRLAGSQGNAFASAAELLSAMDEFGIARALVYTALARESDAIEGNRLLQRKIEGQPRLVPCWAAIPNREPCGQLLERMNQSHVQALRLFPRSGHFSIRPWCIESLAKALEQGGKTLFLDFEGSAWTNDGIDWEGIYQLCLAVPGLPVVVCGVTMAGPSNYDGFIRQCNNLHLEISELVSPGEIKRLVADGLGERLIFGSNMPTRHIGAPLTMVGLETLDVETRHKIMHKNLERILAPLEPLTKATPLREIPRFGDVVDTHMHLGGWNFSASATGRAEDTIRDMDRCGITCAIATSLWSCFGEVALGNEDVAKACAAFPGRIYGYLTLDPKYPCEVKEQIQRYDGNSAFKGVKFHGETHGFHITDPRCADILSYANTRKIPVLVHDEFDTQAWSKVCHLYPDVKFIVAHVGGGGPDSRPAVELARLARTVGNLYFDIAATRNFLGFLEKLIDLAGVGKILYGADHPLMDFGFELGQVFFSRISDEEKQMILSGNARRIFEIGAE